MRTQEKTTPANQIIDLPSLLEIATDSIELGSVRLTACLRSINRLRLMIEDKSLFPEGDDNVQEIFNAASEMELMLEKAESIMNEIYEPSLSALSKIRLFSESGLPKLISSAKSLEAINKIWNNNIPLQKDPEFIKLIGLKKIELSTTKADLSKIFEESPIIQNDFEFIGKLTAKRQSLVNC
ncbi:MULTISPECIES: hypothetical protein [Sphingobacterium]|uniref:Uncharacterized protein n=1 Tax=Sphingobacterium tenebrionis TaxID=3111775 RepID=A0ABU8I4K3_9SPHI|nr:hypothetical protein [Sphingobacterium sp. CZ-2]QBR11486.1 hypothetical protein E3D81_04570 [Sphingobacterium sp. CZ-2]